ncbi:hypothetical protein FA95DRAFT_34920 [Auriscalpium vulgare]|uniref:Uncharacterized protein n=1 Tax=Auriscalpium vulgare TaxID=40419 RepID=A0ACB8SDR2_9AGAM|nr:hypothetical protein FA95DRAFT_34920 [Auriscalpium vulgare]
MVRKTLKDVNQSPFHANNHLARNPRLMDGVRRWMGGHAAAGNKDTRTIQRRRTTVIGQDADLYGYTGSVAAHLLDPVVSEEEEEEYQRYIDQCQGMADEMESGPEEEDVQKYEKVVQMSAGGYEFGSDDGLDSISLAFIQRASADAAGELNVLPITTAYEKFVQRHN